MTHTTGTNTHTNNQTENTMYQTFKAQQEAEAAAWLEEHGDSLPAVVLVGTDTGRGLQNARPEGDSLTHALDLGDRTVLRERTRVSATDSHRRDGCEPTDDLANSMAAPELLGMYCATAAEAARADRERATHGIAELVSVKVGNSAQTKTRQRRKRMTIQEKIAARRAKANPQAIVRETAPLYSILPRRQPAYAHTDAGNGPLSIVDRSKTDTGSPMPEVVRMSPVVDCIGYESGRSPFQVSLRAARNSDITG